MWWWWIHLIKLKWLFAMLRGKWNNQLIWSYMEELQKWMCRAYKSPDNNFMCSIQMFVTLYFYYTIILLLELIEWNSISKRCSYSSCNVYWTIRCTGFQFSIQSSCQMMSSNHDRYGSPISNRKLRKTLFQN